MPTDIAPTTRPSGDELLRLPQFHPLCVLPEGERRDAASAYFEHHVARSLPLHTLEGETWKGLYAWSHLPWDSQQLGLEMGRLHCLLACPSRSGEDGDFVEALVVRGRCLDQVLREAREMGVAYLFTRLDAGDLDTLHVLEERGFRIVDGLLTFARSVQPGDAPSSLEGFGWRLADEADIPRLRELGGCIYCHDRFHADPAIQDHLADSLHEEWLENSVRGRAADFVVVHEAEGRIEGFVTCSLDPTVAPWLQGPAGIIVLVGTSPQASGQGIASALTRVAVTEFARRGAAWVMVGTQLANIRASRVYEGCGFRLVASSLTCRLLL